MKILGDAQKLWAIFNKLRCPKMAKKKKEQIEQQ